MKKTTLCPCGSGEAYNACCGRFHRGKAAQSALELMRARYSAYAQNLPAYIIQTTHPGSPQFHPNVAEWTQKIADFCTHTQFQRLQVLSVQEYGSLATIAFVAHLSQNNKDASFTEKSYFEKLHGRWFYRSGQLAEGHAPNLVTTEPTRLLPLAYYGHPILRKVADPIEKITADVHRLVEGMVDTMNACDGIGLAAPQVHHSVQLFIIRIPIVTHENGKEKIEFGEVKVFINPKISLLSQETWTVAEGCLSIPTIEGQVMRPSEIAIEYTDLSGKQIRERVKGWEARIILHENDHLNGVLFIDHLTAEERKNIDPFLAHLHNRIHQGHEL